MINGSFGQCVVVGETGGTLTLIFLGKE